MVPIAQPLFGDEEYEAIRAVMRSGMLTQGEQVAEFERQFAAAHGTTNGIAVSSGTAALYLALLAHRIGPGDEVITTAFSFAATANAILAVGAKPVFVDIDPETFNINPMLIDAAVSPSTKAIVPVHLYGYPADMYEICAIAKDRHLLIIEDACQAHGASIIGKPVGSFGTGCFSFYATKNITTGEGGMVTTDDDEVAERIRLLRSHGQKERYLHVALGYNLRMTELQAAIGIVQLGKLHKFNSSRIAHAKILSEALAPFLATPMVKPGFHHVFHQYTIRVTDRREEWSLALRAQDVATAIHYPLPIHLQPFYLALGYEVQLPLAEAASKEVLSLPVHPGLSDEQVHKVADAVLELCRPGVLESAS